MDQEEELGSETKLTKELVEQKLAEAQERLEKYKGYQQVIADSP